MQLINDWHGVAMEEIITEIDRCEWIRTASARLASRIRLEAAERGVALSIIKSSGTFVIVRAKN